MDIDLQDEIVPELGQEGEHWDRDGGGVVGETDCGSEAIHQKQRTHPPTHVPVR